MERQASLSDNKMGVTARMRNLLFTLLTLVVFNQSTQAQSMSTFSVDSSAPDIQFESLNGEKSTLSPIFGKNRIIVLFVPAAYETEGIGYLKHLCEREADLTERDLKIFAVAAAESPLQKECFGPLITVEAKCDPMPTLMSPNRDNGPLFILIGKDKSIKLREQKFVSDKALFATIDAMPMRRSEIKAKTAL